MATRKIAPIYYVGGSKGGIGKSMISAALIDTLEQRGEQILLVETDTANPDVAKAYRHIKTVTLDLDRKEGWIDLVDALDRHPDHVVVIQSAARASDGVARFGSILVAALPELRRTMTVLWPINRQRDVLELCSDFRDVLPGVMVHVIRNLYYGSPEKFELYNGSKLKKAIEGAGGQTLDFPDLADRVSDYLNTKRVTIADARSELPMGSRVELDRWRSEAWAMFEKMLG